MQASRWQIGWGRAVTMVGRVLQLLRVPGALQDVEIKDDLTGQCVNVHVGRLFTRLSVNGRAISVALQDASTGPEPGVSSRLVDYKPVETQG